MRNLLVLTALLLCPVVCAEKWTTYHDPKLGLTFQHPPDWSCQWEEGAKTMLMVKAPTEKAAYVGLEISPKNPNNLPIDVWYKAHNPDPKARLEQFAGQPAIVVPRTKGEANYNVFWVARPGGNVLGVVTREFPSDPSGKASVEKILHSCKFDP